MKTPKRDTHRQGRVHCRNTSPTCTGDRGHQPYQVVLCLSNIRVIRTKFVFVDVKGTLVVLLHLVVCTVTTRITGEQSDRA